MHSCSICGDLVADMDCAVTLFFFLEEFINVTPLIKSKKTHAQHASSSNHHYYYYYYFFFSFEGDQIIFIDLYLSLFIKEINAYTLFLNVSLLFFLFSFF